MQNQKKHATLFAPFRQLRWRLTLVFTLVTLASLLMVLWWSFLGISLYLARTIPGASISAIRTEVISILLPLAIPWIVFLVLPAILVGGIFGFITARWLESRLNRLREATDAWTGGDLSARIHDDVRDEITRFGQQLNQMAAEMETLLQTRQELAALEERNQLARDLHDSVKQQLAAAILQVGTAQALLDRDPGAARQALIQSEALALQAQAELTNIILELRPAALHEKGLAGALQTYVTQWGQQSGISAEIKTQEIRQLPYNTELAIFRIAQEALANVARHSQADKVKIILSCQNKTVELHIQDNGRGFDPGLIQSQGFGLKSMSDRLESMKGSLEMSSAPESGTRIVARIPLSGSQDSKGNSV